MLAFTTIIKKSDGTVELRREALHRLPAELVDQFRIKTYCKISGPGWHQSEFGYWAYARLHSNGDLYIYPGLRLSEERLPRKRFPGYSISFSRVEIERYAEDVAKIIDQYHAEVDDDFNILVHDLRRLSTSIYHAAEEADRLLAQDASKPEIKDKIQTVIAAQSMLKLRTDVLDYSGNPTAYGQDELVPIYRRVHKVVKCFAPLASKRGIKVWLEGTNFDKAKGPNVFEIVPYLLIENAIKYSPNNSDVTVKINSNEDFITTEFRSVGPTIRPEEFTAIFKKGVRGTAARETGIPGSGVGLYLAKLLVEQFRGEISAATSESTFIIGETFMTDVTFRVKLPRHKDTNLQERRH